MTDITFPLDAKNVAQCMAEKDAEIVSLRAENERLFLENGKLANTLGAECLWLRATLKGVEIALTRDEDIAGAINLIVTYEQLTPPTSRSD